MSEFDLIRRLQEFFKAAPGAGSPACVVGIGDDCAVLDIPVGKQLVVTSDTLVEVVHFLTGTDAANLGRKVLAVNLSDLASMGAEPAWFFLALTLPLPDQSWLDLFAQGMADQARSTGITLAGGDTTSGPLSITITAMGLVESGQALTRDGARDGDLIVVSGSLGDAAHALATLRSGEIPDPVSRAALECPEPRLQLGRRLRGLATSCIDISDGLIADVGHILEASTAGADIDIERLPCSDQLAGLPGKQKWELQTAGGDDYELCFTLPENRQGELDKIARESGSPLTIIGKINTSGALVCRMADGAEYTPRVHGYDHFPEKNAQ